MNINEKIVELPQELFCIECGKNLRAGFSKFCFDCREEREKMRAKRYRIKRELKEL